MDIKWPRLFSVYSISKLYFSAISLNSIKVVVNVNFRSSNSELISRKNMVVGYRNIG